MTDLMSTPDPTATAAGQSDQGGCGCGGCGCGGGAAAPADASAAGSAGGQAVAIDAPVGGGELDLRGLAPAQRHELVFGAVGALVPGEAVVVVNDHDPLRLRAVLEAQHPGQLTWQYLATGPSLWRVMIGRETCC